MVRYNIKLLGKNGELIKEGLNLTIGRITGFLAPLNIKKGSIIDCKDVKNIQIEMVNQFNSELADLKEKIEAEISDKQNLELEITVLQSKIKNSETQIKLLQLMLKKMGSK